jgi:ankyrin repeat protein
VNMSMIFFCTFSILPYCQVGRTPLHRASTNGDIATVKVLLDFGADKDAVDKVKWKFV